MRATWSTILGVETVVGAAQRVAPDRDQFTRLLPEGQHWRPVNAGPLGAGPDGSGAEQTCHPLDWRANLGSGTLLPNYPRGRRMRSAAPLSLVFLAIAGCTTSAPLDAGLQDGSVGEAGTDAGLAASCIDDVTDGHETDIDCGGPDCRPCPNAKACLTPRDCASAFCVNNLCINGGGESDGAQPPGDMSLAADLSDAALPAVDISLAADLPDAAMCATTLANIGGGDFAIQFVLTTSAKVLSSLLYQRAMCHPDDFWDIRLTADGRIEAETSNLLGNYTALYSNGSVNNAQPHSISISRRANLLSITIDGGLSGSSPSGAIWGNLPPLGTSSGDPCEKVDGTMPLVGMLEDVCITR